MSRRDGGEPRPSMPYDLSQLTIGDLERFSLRARDLVVDCRSMEDAAQVIVDHLAADMHADGAPALTAAHLLKTHRWGRRAAGTRRPAAICLASSVLRHDERAGVATPLDPDAPRTFVTTLFTGLGVSDDDLQSPTPPTHDRRLDVVHLGQPTGAATDTPLLPAGTRDAAAIGALLPDGEAIALLLCARHVIAPSSVELLGTAALSLKAVLTPFTYRVFAEESAER